MIETYYCRDDDIQHIKYKGKLVLKTGKEWRVVRVEYVDNDQDIDTMTVWIEKVKGGK